MLDLEFDAGQQAIGDAVSQFCRERLPADEATAQVFDEVLWRELAALGVFALATPEGGGGALELVAALEALGNAAFPGPLAATLFAMEVLPPASSAAVARGETLVSLGSPPLWPFGPMAGIFVFCEGERVFQAELCGEVEVLETLGAEPWCRSESERPVELAPSPRAFALLDLAHAAFQASAARRLIERAAGHARVRRQFGRTLGEFQAVSHPLADAAVATDGAATLARAAAFRVDTQLPEARTTAAAARLSADRAALNAANVAHQVFGAMGVTLEGPAFRFSRRIRQGASLPPGSEVARDRVLEPFANLLVPRDRGELR